MLRDASPPTRTVRGLTGTAVIAAAALLPLAGTATAAPVDAKNPITVVMPYGDFFKPAVDRGLAICAQRTGIPGRAITDPATYDELNLKLQVQAAAGKAPDVAVQGLNEVISMGDNRYVTNLAPFVRGKRAYSARVQPTLSAGRVKGRQVAIPWGISMPVIFVNTEIFRDAGLNPNAPFRTWRDAAAAAKRLTDTSAGRSGIVFAEQEGWIPLQFLLNAGSNFVDSSGKPRFNDAAGKRAAGFLNDLFTTKAAAAVTEDQAKDLFIKGESAMFVGSTSFIPAFADTDFSWVTLKFPVLDASVPTRIAAGGAGIAVFATPERRAAATRVVDCMMDLRVIKVVVEKLGYMPVRTDARKVLKKGLLTRSPFKAPSSQFSAVVPWYAFPGRNGAQARKLFSDSWARATQASSDPDPLLDQAASRIGSLLR